jgi:hypothetical protein
MLVHAHAMATLHDISALKGSLKGSRISLRTHSTPMHVNISAAHVWSRSCVAEFGPDLVGSISWLDEQFSP